MRSRGGDRPDEGPDERRDPRAKTRRWGRGRAAEPEPEEPVAGEEFGWIDDLRSAKQQRTELGPDGAPAEPSRPAAGAPAAPAGPRTGAPAAPAGGRGGAPVPPEAAAPPAPRQTDPGAGPRRPVDGPWPGRRRLPAATRMSGHPRPAPVHPPRASRRAEECSRHPLRVPPYHQRHPPPDQLAATRPAHRGLAPTRPAARSAPAPRRFRPAHPWALRPPAPRPVAVRMLPVRPVAVRTLPRPGVTRTRCRRCADRTPERRAADRAPSPSSPAARCRLPTARPPAAGPPVQHPIQLGAPGRPPPQRGTTARRPAPSRRSRMACDPTPPSTVTRVPPGAGQARSTPARRSPPAPVPLSAPARQPAATAAPPNPTSRWCPARATRRRCPQRPAVTAARRPPSPPPTARVAAGPPPTSRSGVRRPAANLDRTARSGPPTGCARPVACRTPTRACRWSTAEAGPRRPRAGVPYRPPAPVTSSTRRLAGSAYPIRPRSAPLVAGPPGRRPTRARRDPPVVVPYAPTRRVPPENRRRPIRRRPATVPVGAGAPRRLLGSHSAAWPWGCWCWPGRHACSGSHSAAWSWGCWSWPGRDACSGSGRSATSARRGWPGSTGAGERPGRRPLCRWATRARCRPRRTGSGCRPFHSARSGPARCG